VRSGFEGETISNKTQVQTIASFHNYLIIWFHLMNPL
jgi:hypothetical protein